MGIPLTKKILCESLVEIPLSNLHRKKTSKFDLDEELITLPEEQISLPPS